MSNSTGVALWSASLCAKWTYTQYSGFLSPGDASLKEYSFPMTLGNALAIKLHTWLNSVEITCVFIKWNFIGHTTEKCCVLCCILLMGCSMCCVFPWICLVGFSFCSLNIMHGLYSNHCLVYMSCSACANRNMHGYVALQSSFTLRSTSFPFPWESAAERLQAARALWTDPVFTTLFT